MNIPIIGKYKKTGLTNFGGANNITLETNWNTSASKRELLRITIGKEETMVSFSELLTGLMIHAKDNNQEKISKGFFEKSKKKRVIDYKVHLIAANDIKKGSPINATVQLDVPEELLNLDLGLKSIGGKRNNLA